MRTPPNKTTVQTLGFTNFGSLFCESGQLPHKSSRRLRLKIPKFSHFPVSPGFMGVSFLASRAELQRSFQKRQW
ncbi:hypothetical protein K443DRAFT_678634 [Laccaria amethystina LaAM-08-1]|uniref:Uncharacterized protein n=1 Tax=Laccaria amethystina LaAM-08-1 TaxID=1095629 RepID=A0A0C9XI08_9AGAR|nr:hypothetical protein K443DRAFT_678634 [Laccaria amethystina LaAM-08-1]